MKSREPRLFLDMVKSTFFGLLLLVIVGYSVFVVIMHKLTTPQPVLLVDSPPNIMAIDNSSYGYGFMDRDGVPVISAAFHEARPFSEGLAAVRGGMKWGYIDRYAKYAVTPQYEEVWQYINGVALVRKDLDFKFIDRTGKVLKEFQDVLEILVNSDGSFLTCSFDGVVKFYNPDFTLVTNESISHAYNYSCGIFTVKLDSGHVVYMDRTGKIIYTAPEGTELPWFIDGYSVVKNENGFDCLIDKSGSVVLDCEALDLRGIHLLGCSDGMIEFRVIDTEQKLSGYLNMNGEIVIEPFITSTRPFRDGLAWVLLSKHEIATRSHGLIVWEDSAWCVIDKTGKIVNEPGFVCPKRITIHNDYIVADFTYGVFCTGVIDWAGKTVIPPIFFGIREFSCGMAMFSLENNTLGFVDEKGNVILSNLPARGTGYHDINKTGNYGLSRWMHGDCDYDKSPFANAFTSR